MIPKATVLQVGTVEMVGVNFRLAGWHFDCRGEVPLLEDSPEGTRVAGFLIVELIAIDREHHVVRPAAAGDWRPVAPGADFLRLRLPEIRSFFLTPPARPWYGSRTVG